MSERTPTRNVFPSERAVVVAELPAAVPESVHPVNPASAQATVPSASAPNCLLVMTCIFPPVSRANLYFKLVNYAGQSTKKHCFGAVVNERLKPLEKKGAHR